MKKPNLSRLTLKEQVYDYLKTAITSGDLQPGQRLIEEKIAEDLSVSRSPVREAVHILEKDGLLTFHGTGGLAVANPSVEDYQHLYECRIEMESLAAYYAAERRSEQELELMKTCLAGMQREVDNHDIKEILTVNFNFHELIVKSSHNPFLIDLTMQLRGINSFYRKAILENNPAHVEHAFRDHEQIYLSILDRDAVKARKLMKAHIDRDFQSFMSTKGNE